MKTLTVCAVFKNEGPYLLDWLTFHFGAGVDHFVLFDDASDDNSSDVLAPWIEKGIVTCYPTSGKSQRALYNDALHKLRHQTEWLAFLDLDEYLFSPKGFALPTVLAGFAEEVAIFVYWHLFGSGGQISRPNQPVPLSFVHCLPLHAQFSDTFCHGISPDASDYVTGWSLDGKSLVRPEFVEEQGVHKPVTLYGGQLVNERHIQAVQRSTAGSPSAELLRINHYWSRSIEEFHVKISRGSICNRSRPPRQLDRWLEREAQLNHSFDSTLAAQWHHFVSKAVDRGAPVESSEIL